MYITSRVYIQICCLELPLGNHEVKYVIVMLTQGSMHGKLACGDYPKATPRNKAIVLKVLRLRDTGRRWLRVPYLCIISWSGAVCNPKFDTLKLTVKLKLIGRSFQGTKLIGVGSTLSNPLGSTTNYWRAFFRIFGGQNPYKLGVADFRTSQSNGLCLGAFWAGQRTWLRNRSTRYSL